jgi:prepilin-type N-terminal cleavage/methylation domain-containing protein
MRNQNHRLGVSLVELIVVLAVIAVLCSFGLPAVMMAREAARIASCQSNLRQIGISFHTIASARGRLPRNQPTPWTISVVREWERPTIENAIPAGTNEALVAWDLLPLAMHPIKNLRCPTAKEVLVDGRHISNYGMNQYLPNSKLEGIPDGSSNTLLAGEIPSEFAALWTWGPMSVVENMGSSHSHRVHSVQADGSVRSIRWPVDPKLLASLFIPDDGRSLDE